MKEQFQKYLIARGYSVKTPAGNPSTVYDYQKRINKICEWENTTWAGLAANIGAFVFLYDVGGEKEEQGKESKSAYINALKRFSEFLQGA
ncbi:MAG: hypothetical protein WBL93_14735 [Lutisporaceae bacterium]